MANKFVLGQTTNLLKHGVMFEDLLLQPFQTLQQRVARVAHNAHLVLYATVCLSQLFHCFQQKPYQLLQLLSCVVTLA